MNWRFSTHLCLLVFALLATLDLSGQVPGTLDPSFDGDGIVTTDIGGIDNIGRGMVVQSDGKIVVLGGRDSTGTPVLARYLENGSLDASFGSGGIVFVAPIGGYFKALALQADGKIVIFASVNTTSVHNFTAVRYNPDGSQDLAFGQGGYATASFGTGLHFGNALVVQPDGKIIAAGAANIDSPSQFALARFNADGSIDTTFGDGGKVATPFPDTTDGSQPTSVCLAPDGKIVLSGVNVSATTFRDFAVARYNTDGSLDTGFGSSGIKTTHISFNDIAYDSVIQSDGKIVLAGVSNNQQAYTLVRYNLNGSLDTTFDGDGKVVTTFPPPGDNYITALVLQPDGKLLAAGKTYHGNGGITLIRYGPTGAIDSSFGTNGQTTVGVGPNHTESAADMALQSDGKIVIAGSTVLTFPNYDLLVMRLLNDASLVRPSAPFDFDGDHKADLSVFRPSVGEWYYQRSLDGLVNGFGFGSSTDKPVPADYTGDGKTDIAFFRPSDSNWFVLRSDDLTYYAFPFGANGDIPVVGDFDGDGQADPGVYRPSAQTWFIARSTGGVLTVPFGLAGDVPEPADYDGDGKSDVAIYRPSVGQWWILRSMDNSVFAATFGDSNDKPVPGDYTGDGKADIAFYRPSEGNWYVIRSEDQSFYAFPFGNSADKPAPADFDGDGKYDAAVFRPSDTNWYILRSTGGVTIQQFGAAGDVPLPGAFVP